MKNVVELNGLNYIHVSKYVYHGVAMGKGGTMNIGRNAEKRRIRSGLPRKQWPVLSQTFGYLGEENE